MSDYDAIVYDLDGTLVDLDVDWGTVATDVLEVYTAADCDPPSRDLWELLDVAAEFGLDTAVEAAIADHECAGARTSPALERADGLSERTVPVGVCSLNCEEACRAALERHDLLEFVDVVVGRDTVETCKPDPEPLLAAVEALSASPERTLFVGDTRRDEVTAKRAGTDFEYVGGVGTAWIARSLAICESAARFLR